MRPRFCLAHAARLIGCVGLFCLPLVVHAADPPTPLLNDDTLAVVRIDLARLDVPAVGRLIPQPAAVSGVIPHPLATLMGRSVDRLKAAGLTEAILLVTEADLPGPPILAVAASGADAEQVRVGALEAVRLSRLAGPAAVTARLIRGWAVVGATAAVDRLEATPPTPRLDLRAALDASGRRPSIAHAAIAPSSVLRRALAEVLPELPAGLGREPIRPLTDGLLWGMVALSDAAQPRLVVELQARDPAATDALVALLGRVRTAGVPTLRANPITSAVAPILEGLKFEVGFSPGRISLDTDARTVVPLILAPFRLADADRQRQEAIDQFKTLGLAINNYDLARNTFPPAYRADQTGKPLLSWRVLILPYLDEQALFNEFHLDEAWDSPHNKALIPRMPRVYASPDLPASLIAEGRTTTLAPRGPNTTISNDKGVRLAEITDGSGLTVMIIQGADKDAVSWTRPEDYPANTPPDLKGQRPLALFADGSVRRIRPDIRLDVFRALLTASGGEVIYPNDL